MKCSASRPAACKAQQCRTTLVTQGERRIRTRTRALRGDAMLCWCGEGNVMQRSTFTEQTEGDERSGAKFEALRRLVLEYTIQVTANSGVKLIPELRKGYCT